jgi:hypothetical protein
MGGPAATVNENEVAPCLDHLGRATPRGVDDWRSRAEQRELHSVVILYPPAAAGNKQLS